MNANNFARHSFDGYLHWNKVRHCSPQHLQYDVYNKLFDLNRFDYIFASVRNPLDRLFSEFKWHLKNSKDLRIEDFSKWSIASLSNYESNNYIYDNHLRPQSEFLFNGIEVFKHESNFTAEYFSKLLSKRLKLNIVLKPPSASFNNRNFKEMPAITQKCLKTIISFYKDDYKLLGYQIPVF